VRGLNKATLIKEKEFRKALELKARERKAER
jgi:hypothetical protein